MVLFYQIGRVFPPQVFVLSLSLFVGLPVGLGFHLSRQRVYEGPTEARIINPDGSCGHLGVLEIACSSCVCWGCVRA
jgi:hypothetical protein